MQIAHATLITDATAWQSCLADLRRQRRLALDLEANSLYAYRERICLIQISTDTADYVVDPLAPLDLSGLGAILGDPAVEKVFHAAEYDLFLLKRQYGWEVVNLFDTMWAARVLGYARVGLGNLLEEAYGVEVDKRHQKADWCKRPLARELLAYAQTDTHYLLQLRDELGAALGEAGRLEEAAEIFAEQAQVTPPEVSFDPDGFWSINGVRDLSPRQQAVLRGLYLFRDQQAQRQDRPPFKILGDRTLLDLADREPSRVDDLNGVFGMSEGQMRRYGRAIVETVRRAAQEPPPKRPARNPDRPAEAVIERYDRLHMWRKERAQARGVESDVILSRDALWALARRNPRTSEELADVPGLSPWRRQTYGEEILRVLERRPGRRR